MCEAASQCMIRLFPGTHGAQMKRIESAQRSRASHITGLASWITAGQMKSEIQCPQRIAAIWLTWDPDVMFLFILRM